MARPPAFNLDYTLFTTRVFQSIVDKLAEPVYVTDEEGQIVYANSAADRQGATIPASWKEALEIARSKRREIHRIIKSSTPDGHASCIKLTVIPITSSDGFPYGTICVEKDLSGVEELEKKKVEFISIASHQLRTPLGAMRWNLEMLLAKEFGKVPREIKKIVSLIYRSNLRMIILVNDLLSVSRIDQGRVFDEPKPTDICAIIKQVAGEIAVEAQKKAIHGELHFDKKPIPKIVIDAKRFIEVMHNLLTNAIKYNKRGGRIKVEVKRTGESIAITVSDTGMGISDKERKNIFSRYFRAENAIRITNEGTGLGLYIVKAYIEGWGGSISFTSTVNKGTTFTVVLPLKPRRYKHHDYFASKVH